MSGTPPTIENDGESDYEQEPFGIGQAVIYDEEPDDLVWKPMGRDTDPWAFLPRGNREHLLPLPNRGNSIAGVPAEYGSKWPKPGHLFSKQIDSHLEGPMFKDRLTLNDQVLGAIKPPAKRCSDSSTSHSPQRDSSLRAVSCSSKTR